MRTLWNGPEDRNLDPVFFDLHGSGFILGLNPISDVRRHILTDQPWLASDQTLGPWPDPADQAVFQTGAWILPDERPLSPELEAFLESGEPPVYFGFGSIRSPEDLSQVMIQSRSPRDSPPRLGGPVTHGQRSRLHRHR